MAQRIPKSIERPNASKNPQTENLPHSSHKINIQMKKDPSVTQVKTNRNVAILNPSRSPLFEYLIGVVTAIIVEVQSQHFD